MINWVVEMGRNHSDYGSYCILIKSECEELIAPAKVSYHENREVHWKAEDLLVNIAEDLMPSDEHLPYPSREYGWIGHWYFH